MHVVSRMKVRVKGIGMVLGCTLSVLLTGCQLGPSSNTANQALKMGVTAQVHTSRESQMMQHVHALQKIADQHGGNRAVGTAGGQATASYIVQQAKVAGFTAQLLPFENREKTVGHNVVIEVAGKSKDTAIIVGAHYDSVKMGPGINDNGSGVAVLLALLAEARHQQPEHTLYFTFWDSEEVGVAGSQAFVQQLTSQQLKGIQAYINVDMVGTKQPNIMIADGDHSSVDDLEKLAQAQNLPKADIQPMLDGLRALPKHPKDKILEQHLRTHFAAQGLTIKDDLSTLTASDTAAFLGKVPVTSIILFNEQMKGNELEFAPCYHKACDRIDLIDPSSMQLAANCIQSVIEFLSVK